MRKAAEGGQLDKDRTQRSHVNGIIGSSQYPRHMFGLEELGEELDDRQISELRG